MCEESAHFLLPHAEIDACEAERAKWDHCHERDSNVQYLILSMSLLDHFNDKMRNIITNHSNNNSKYETLVIHQ